MQQVKGLYIYKEMNRKPACRQAGSRRRSPSDKEKIFNTEITELKTDTQRKMKLCIKEDINHYSEEYYNKLTGSIIEGCIEVHKELGPGLMESVYQVCLIAILRKKSIHL